MSRTVHLCLSARKQLTSHYLWCRMKANSITLHIYFWVSSFRYLMGGSFKETANWADSDSTWKVFYFISSLSLASAFLFCFVFLLSPSTLTAIIQTMVTPSSSVLFRSASFWQENAIQLFCCIIWRKKVSGLLATVSFCCCCCCYAQGGKMCSFTQGGKGMSPYCVVSIRILAHQTSWLI